MRDCVKATAWAAPRCVQLGRWTACCRPEFASCYEHIGALRAATAFAAAVTQTVSEELRADGTECEKAVTRETAHGLCGRRAERQHTLGRRRRSPSAQAKPHHGAVAGPVVPPSAVALSRRSVMPLAARVVGGTKKDGA